MMKTKIAQKMALAQTNGFFSAFRIPTISPLLQTASHIMNIPNYIEGKGKWVDKFDSSLDIYKTIENIQQ